MDARELLQDQLSNLIWLGVCALASGVWWLLKKRKARGADQVRGALVVFACLMVVVFQYRTFNLFQTLRPKLRVDSSNVEQAIKEWAESTRYGVRRLNDTPGQNFGYLIEAPNGKTEVRQPKDIDRYLEMASSLAVSPEHKASLNILPKEEMDRLISEIKMELVKANLEYKLEGQPLSKVTIIQHVLVDGLTEQQFMSALHSVNMGKLLANELIVGAALRVKPPKIKQP